MILATRAAKIMETDEEKAGQVETLKDGARAERKRIAAEVGGRRLASRGS